MLILQYLKKFNCRVNHKFIKNTFGRVEQKKVYKRSCIILAILVWKINNKYLKITVMFEFFCKNYIYVYIFLNRSLKE